MGQGQADEKGGPLVAFQQVQLPPVGSKEGADKTEAEACPAPIFFGGEKGLENRIQEFIGYARPVIGHINFADPADRIDRKSVV